MFAVFAVATMLAATEAVGAPAVTRSVPKGWIEDFEAAKRQAATEGKFILMDFSGSDWCGWCRKMDEEVFSQSKFIKEASKQYVLVMIDSPSDKSILSKLAQEQNGKLRAKYGVRGFPSVVIVDSAGEVVKRHAGYRKGGPKGYMKYLKELMDGVKWPEKKPEAKAPDQHS
jgi:thioredoxin-related protein